jgi:hypothetical protein
MIEWILVLLAIPFGMWLRNAASDELKAGRKWFNILLVAAIIGTIVFVILGEKAASVTCLAIVIFTWISLQSKKRFK